MTTPVLREALPEHAMRHGDRPALTYVDFDAGREEATSTWSYAETHRHACAVGAAVGGYDRVAVLCPPGLDYAAAFLGCLYAGVPAVPLYPPQPGRPDAHLRAVLRSAAPGCVLTTAPYRQAVTDTVADMEPPPVVRCVDGASGPEPVWRPGETAYVQYTSGSTSRPRGVLVTHDNLAHMVAQLCSAYGLGPDSVGVSWLPLFHDMGLATGLTVPLSLGYHVVLMSPPAFVKHPGRWLRLLSSYRATFTAVPNFALDLCVARVSEVERASLDLSALAVVANGSEPVRARSLRAFTDAFAGCGFSPAAHRPSYGLAEATLLVTAETTGAGPLVLSCDRAALGAGHVVPAGGAGCRELVGCGVPVGQRIAIVDPEAGRTLPPDRVGEVRVRGPNVAAGYLGRPDDTREVFGDGWLRTGDLGFIHKGQLFLAGRRKDVIVVDGRNHDPADVEATVQAAAPLLRPGRIAAFSVDVGDVERLVVMAETAAPDPGRDAVRRAVAEQHGIALHDLVTAPPGELPMTTSGKPRRAACRERYLALAAIEQRVAGVVAALLGVPASGVDPDRPLAELGLSSRDAVAVSGELETFFDVRPLLPTLLWERPTVRRIAAHLTALGATERVRS